MEIGLFFQDCLLPTFLTGGKWDFQLAYLLFATVYFQPCSFVVVVVLLFYVHGKHLRSCRDGQLT